MPDAAPQTIAAPHLTKPNNAASRFSFFTVLTAELKLLLKGQRWWWYAAAVGVIIACFASPSATTREIVLPLAWIWPLLIWAAIGNREVHHNVQQLTFSSASPLWRQLPAQWLAGFVVTLLMAGGAALRFVIDGDTVGLLALLSGALFIHHSRSHQAYGAGPANLLKFSIWSSGISVHSIKFPGWILSARTAMSIRSSSSHLQSR